MSFNVFDESPENKNVIKEQQANKMPVEYFLWITHNSLDKKIIVLEGRIGMRQIARLDNYGVGIVDWLHFGYGILLCYVIVYIPCEHWGSTGSWLRSGRTNIVIIDSIVLSPKTMDVHAEWRESEWRINLQRHPSCASSPSFMPLQLAQSSEKCENEDGRCDQQL